MFEMGARDHSAEKVYRDYLAQSDIFVGIYWETYGWIAPDREVSGLEDELQLVGDKPRLIYLKEPAPERDPRLAAMIERVQGSGVATKNITSPDDLADQLSDDIAHLVFERFSAPGRQLPTGTVTFMFADVEGSTPMLEQFGAAYSELLVRFRRDGQELIEGAGGTLVKTEGDGIFAVFPSADVGLRVAVAAQRTYQAYPHPGPLKVRMGLHSGTGVVVGGDYAGLDVHRAARVGSAASGGQILMSSSTRELVREWQVASVTDLGWFELKGLTHAEHLHQVDVPDLASEFPPVRATPSARARIPRQLTSIVGRERDIEAIAALVEEARLVTLTGPGGIGKTRLAVAVADRVESRFRDGVGFVNLASIDDPDRVAETIMTVLGRTIEGTASAEDLIADELKDRQFLLILDNFEQLTPSAPLLRSLLERLPQLRILVTSRIALQLIVEREYQVAPLALPETGANTDAIAASPAVRLLVDRARAARPDMSISSENGPALADLARRLDGIPLALELAAARMRLLGPADLVKRLTSTLDLGSGAADLPARQRTLRAAIDWSYRTLAPSEQLLFVRLGIFVGGWTLEAAEALTGGPEVGDVAAVLETLAAHSLIRLESASGGEPRMRMLGPLQDYARETLSESGAFREMEARHASFYVHKVDAYPRGTGVGLEAWRIRTDLDWGNIRQAVATCISRGDFPALARLVNSLWPLLWVEDRADEALGWLRVLRPHLDDLELAVRAKTVYVDGFFALEVGEFQRAVDFGLQALELAKAAADEEQVAMSQLLLAGSLPAFGLDDPRIEEFIEEAVSAFRHRGDTVNLAYALNFLCSLEAARGNTAAARAAIEEALVLAKEVEALPIAAQSSAALAFVELISGDLDAAERCLVAAVQALEGRPSSEVMSYVLDAYGWWALVQGRTIPGLTALGAAEGLRARVGLRVWPLTAAQITLLAQMADAYDDPDAQAARRAGRELSPAAALAVVTSPAQSASSRASLRYGTAGSVQKES
jgi:predicted ATPase/class 3 adenylate cyclase